MWEKTANVVVIGSLNMDIVIDTPRLPIMGETILGENIHFFPGGKGANQAVAASKLGAITSLIGAVGNDPFGKELLVSLETYSVHNKMVKTVNESATGTASILLVNGDNCIVVVPGANAECLPIDIDQHEEEIAKADIVLIQMEIPMNTVTHAVEVAKRHGKIVILNPAPAQPLSESLLEKVDYITPNTSELKTLVGLEHKTVETAVLMRQLLDKGVGNVIVTLGGDGVAFCASDGQIERVTGHHMEVVDTTGAGDAFNAGLAVALAQNKSLKEAVYFANSVSALAVTKKGAQNGMPYLKDVHAFMSTTSN